jgi:hypothetical protein
MTKAIEVIEQWSNRLNGRMPVHREHLRRIARIMVGILAPAARPSGNQTSMAIFTPSLIVT